MRWNVIGQSFRPIQEQDVSKLLGCHGLRMKCQKVLNVANATHSFMYVKLSDGLRKDEAVCGFVSERRLIPSLGGSAY